MVASPSAGVMAQLDLHFDCYHLWQQPREQQAAWLAGVAPRVRGVLTTGAIGIKADLLAQLPKVEIVAVNGIGTDAVDLARYAGPWRCRHQHAGRADRRRGRFGTDACCCRHARRLPALDTFVRDGSWEAGQPIKPTRALRGKVCGIYGFGRIGQAIGARAQAFGMELLQYFQPRALEDSPVPRAESLLALAESQRISGGGGAGRRGHASHGECGGTGGAWAARHAWSTSPAVRWWMKMR